MYLFVNYFCKINIDWPRIPHQKVPHIPFISMRSEVSIHYASFQLCSSCYTAVQINSLKSNSVIKVTLKKWGWFPLHKGSLLSAKMDRTQRRMLVSPWRMHCMFCSMPKCTSQAEAMSNREKIKPVTLVIIKLHWSEGIRQAGRQAGRRVGRRAGRQTGSS